MVIARTAIGMLLALSALGGCDVPVRKLDTGGISLGGAGGGEPTEPGCVGGAGATPECARGFVVVGSDYQSSNVSLLDPSGDVLSASFISSASTSAGLSAALTGDVVSPSLPSGRDRIVLIDRYPAGVLTWVDLRSSEVTGQLSVATGFASNPHDYVELSPSKAYVPRFEPNPDPGQEPFDGGNDLVIIDPSGPAIVGRIDLSPVLADVEGGFLPRADRALLVGERVVVLLGGYRPDFLETAPSRLVAVDPKTDELVQTLVLDGTHACSSLAVAPTQDELAVACAGEWGGDNRPDIATSGVVRVRVSTELEVIRRHPATDFGEGPVASGLSYASARHLLFVTSGRFEVQGDLGADDTLIELDLETGASRVVLRSAGEPFTLGDVRCDAVCGVCFVTDAEREGGVVHRLAVSDDGVGSPTAIRVENEIGLPPRALGSY